MKLKFKILVTLTALVLSLSAQAQEHAGKIYKGFIGGMFVHRGHTKITTEIPNDISAYCFGIGGKIAFNFGNYFRIGSEGYSSHYSYGGNGSYLSLGWGGILLESGKSFTKFRIIAGATFGGGGIKNLYIISGKYTDFDKDTVIFRKNASFIYAPYCGIEIFLGKKLTLVSKIDFVSNLHKQFEGNNTLGARYYVGIMFRK